MGLFDKLLGKKPETPAAPATQTAPPKAQEHSCGCGHDHGHCHDEGHEDWQDQGVPQELQPAEVRRRMEQDPKPVLLDVREKRELLADGWIPGSVHIPTSEIERRVGELDLSKPHIVYCASGMRSFDVGFLLIQNGCREVVNLNGGIRAWDGEKQKEQG